MDNDEPMGDDDFPKISPETSMRMTALDMAIRVIGSSSSSYAIVLEAAREFLAFIKDTAVKGEEVGPDDAVGGSTSTNKVKW